VQRVGLLVGPPLAAAAALLLPESYAAADGSQVAFGPGGRATVAVTVWMATWWLSEAIPVYATALLPLVVLPLLGAASMKSAAAPYAHPLIFLFMGGFLLALSMERWGLHRRIALRALGVVGTQPDRMIGGFMAVTALLSMWVSNTATAVMMLPVALSVIELVRRGEPAESAVRAFATALLLSIAYAASIGGLATPIGTPPNLFLLSFMKAQLGRDISFVRWMGVGLPLVVVFLPLTWLLLTRLLYPVQFPRIEGGDALVAARRRELGPMNRGERITFVVFMLACTLWVTRPLWSALEVSGVRPFEGLSDTGIAMLAAVLLFVSPVDWRAHRMTLDWETAVKLPWGILVLFGGGLSLAAAIDSNGVGELIASQVAGFAGAPSLLLVLGVTAGVVFLTELTSNTATAATLIPILAALAPGLGVEPMLLIVPAALAASCAFMLPVATPPNAVIFGSGEVSIPEMARAGLWLNLVGIVLITALAYLVMLPLLAAR